MRWIGWTTAALVACSTANIAAAQCLCDEQCPEETLCRQGRCFKASGDAAVGGAARVTGAAAGGVGAVGETGGAGLDAGGDVGIDGQTGAGVHGDLGDEDGSLGSVSTDGDAGLGASADGDLDVDGTAAGVGAGTGTGVAGSAAAGGDAALATDPTIDASAEVEPLGPDYSVPIGGLVGLGGAVVATAIGALVFGDGLDISVVPVAGPLIKFGQDIDEGFSLGTGLQLMSGIGQVGAVVIAVLGFVTAAAPDCPGVGDVACGERSLAVTPFLSPGALGLGAGGTF